MSSDNSEAYFIHALGEVLGKSVIDICDNMNTNEIIGWSAYFEEKNRREKKVMHRRR